MVRGSGVCGVNRDICIEADHDSLIVAQGVPIGLWCKGFAKIEWLRGLPAFRTLSAGWMVDDNFLQTSPHDLRKTHLVFKSNSFCLSVKGIWDLDLRFYHDGNLPASASLSTKGLPR